MSSIQEQASNRTRWHQEAATWNRPQKEPSGPRYRLLLDQEDTRSKDQEEALGALRPRAWTPGACPGAGTTSTDPLGHGPEIWTQAGMWTQTRACTQAGVWTQTADQLDTG